MKLYKKAFCVFGLFSFLISTPLFAKKADYIDGEKVEVRAKKVQQLAECGFVRPIRVAGFVTNPPFGWVTMQQESVHTDKMIYINNGYAIDLFTSISKKMNLKVKNVGYLSYQTALRDLRKGKIDVIAGVYFNKNILGVGTNLLFPSFMDNPMVPIFVKGKEKNIKTFEDLKNLKGVVRQEELIYPLIYRQLVPGTNLKQVSGSKKAFEMLLKGDVDYMLTSLYAGEAEVRRFKLVDKITFSNTALINPKLFFAFASSTDCQKLKKLYTAELKNMQKDSANYKQHFISYVDKWGQDFKDEKSLIDMIQKQTISTSAQSLENMAKEDENNVPLDENEIDKQSTK